MKTIQFALLYCAALLLLAAPAAVRAQFTFTTNNNTITITGYTGPGGAVTIPYAINGWPVTSIGSGAFQNYTNPINVTIPNSVVTIGDYAFQFCGGLTNIVFGTNVARIGVLAFEETSLANVSLPASVTNLGYDAFAWCPNLAAITVATNNPAYRSVAGVLFDRNQTTLIEYPQRKAGGSYTIPNSVTNLGDYAFNNCSSLTNLALSTNLTSIGQWAFAACGSLTSIIIPDCVTSIGDWAFQFCGRLTNVIIGADATNLGSFVFEDCTSLEAITVSSNNPAYSSVDGVLFNQDQTTLIQYPQSRAGSSYTIPNSVTNIGQNAFRSCANLTSITFPASVVSIGDYAFAAGGPWVIPLDEILSSFTTPEFLVFFLGNAPAADSTVFNDQSNVTVYYLPGTTGWGSTFAGAPTTTWNPSVGLLQATILPETAVWDGAQWQVDGGPWQSSGSVAGNLSLGNHTVNFSTITGWSTSASQTVFIGSNAIATVTGTYVQIPFGYTTNNGTVTITYYDGPGGTATIPANINGLPVTSIGNPFYASFFFDSALTNLTIPSSITNIADGTFRFCPSLMAINVDANNPAYSSEAGVLFNQSQTTLIQYPEDKAGSNYTIPNSITNLEDFAFYSCSNLTSITITNSVISIGNSAFENACLSRVTLGNRVASLGELAFAGCAKLTSVTIPNSVTNVGFEAFQDCFSLTAINVNAGNPSYDSVAGVLFNKKQTMLIQYPEGKRGGSYTIPESVTDIGQAAFLLCTNLDVVTISSRVASIGSSAFARTLLNQVVIPDNARSIGAGAFSYCPKLNRITIGRGVTNLAGFLPLGGRLPIIEPIEPPLLPPPIARVADSVGLFSVEAPPFHYCTNLTTIDVNPLNPAYTSTDGVLFNKHQTLLIQYPDRKPGAAYTIPASVTDIGTSAFQFCSTLKNVTIPDRVGNIGESAFQSCANLTSVSIGNSVTNIAADAFYGCTNLTQVTFGDGLTYLGDGAFASCPNLTGAWFQGNAPGVDTNWYAYPVFSSDTLATAYYLTNTTGWGTNFGGIPTALRTPRVLSDERLGVREKWFGFNLAGANNQVVVVEACTNLFHPVWQPVQTNTLTSGPLYFSDPQWTNYPARFYRVRSP